jgi:hypothetical protein
MRMGAIRSGDIVYVNKRGRLFHAKVVDVDAAGTILVEPIERNVSYRHAQASEISAHWAQNTTKRTARTQAPDAQAPLAL